MTDFKSAFRAARAAGKSTFKWNGGSYNTKLAPDTPTPPKRPADVTPRQRQLPPADVGRPRASEPAERTWKPPAEIADKPAPEAKVADASADAPKQKGWGDKWREASGYAKGGFVPARASGKRDYAKGKQSFKCGGKVR